MEEKHNHSNDPNSTQPVDEMSRFAEKPSSEKKEPEKETTPTAQPEPVESKEVSREEYESSKLDIDPKLMKEPASPEDLERFKDWSRAKDLTKYDIAIIDAAEQGKPIHFKTLLGSPLLKNAMAEKQKLPSLEPNDMRYEQKVDEAVEECRKKMLNPDYGVKKERKAIIALGYPASGKSTFIKRFLNSEQGFAEIDSDKIKECEAFEEWYHGGIGAGCVQEASSEANSRILNEAIQDGTNIALPVVCNGYKRLASYLAKLHENGYEISIDVNDTPIGYCFARSIKRLAKDGRLTPPTYMKKLVQEGLHKQYALEEKEFEKGGTINGVPIKSFTHSGILAKNG